ncbi:MAG: NAD(P)/FAD-dependent oxidoreductase [Hyphomicrobiaceae bacterium]
MKIYDFAVIGGGMAGASTAYELARHGSVALIERETQPGYHSTSRSAATLIEGYGTDVWRAIGSASRLFMDNPPDGFAEHPILSPRGDLSVGREDQTDTIRAECDKVSATGVKVELVDAQGVRDLCPTLKPDMWAAGYYEPGAADIDVDALLQGYLRSFRANGGEIFLGTGVEVISKPDDWQVTFGAETIACRTLVNAAGAWADELASMAGLPARGLQPKRRTAIAFAAPDDMSGSDAWPMVGDFSETFYFRPLSSGQFMGSMADETDSLPCDCQPEELDIAITADRIQNATTMTIPRLDHTWAGLRTFAPDRNPVIGPDPSDETFIWIAGQGGTGIIGAPAAAQLAACIVTGNGIPQHLAGINLEDISPARLEAAS